MIFVCWFAYIFMCVCLCMSVSLLPHFLFLLSAFPFSTNFNCFVIGYSSDFWCNTLLCFGLSFPLFICTFSVFLRCHVSLQRESFVLFVFFLHFNSAPSFSSSLKYILAGSVSLPCFSLNV